MDLGKKNTMVFDNPTSGQEDKKYYPSVTLPLSILKGLNLSVGDKVSLDLTGVITSLTQDQYGNDCRIELQEGTAEVSDEEATEGE